MSTAIGWTDETWNPVVGCTRVSEGCTNCYAEKFANRLEAMGKAQYAGLTRKHADGSVNWTGVVRCLPERLEIPHRWKKARRVFVNSMSDLFHEDVPDDFIDQVFAVMSLAPQHKFQVLTKRPERMRGYFADLAYRTEQIGIDAEAISGLDRYTDGAATWALPLPNCWLGVSTEDQATADERIPLLLQTPAAVRFISAEPLLGPIDLTHIDVIPEEHRLDGIYPYLNALTGVVAGPDDQFSHLDWVIVGGESGGPPERRLSEDRSDWVRSIRDQCTTAGVPLFFKQWGGVTPKAGGRLLDGRTWDQFPQPAAERAGRR